MEKKTYIENDYSVVVNDKGELLFMIVPRQTAPASEPVILYDGGDHAIFYRNKAKDDVVILDYMTDEIKDSLLKSKIAKVAEIKEKTQEVVRNYEAVVKKVKILPNRKVFEKLPSFGEMYEKAEKEMLSMLEGKK